MEMMSVDVVGAMSDALLGELTTCWLDVANAGGAVGFPFVPVSQAVVEAAVADLAAEIQQGDVVLVQARFADELVGWVTLRLNPSKLTSHWATVERLQSHPLQRGAGVGGALLACACDHARSMGLEELRLALRGGEGLETFYERRGWVEIGRHRNALRLRDGDDRDEVTMVLRL
jgi:GNAT superfamily N-acetyltransferase